MRLWNYVIMDEKYMNMEMSGGVRKHARVDAADVLRGFSVLAIVLLHSIEHFNFYKFPEASTRGWLAVADRAVWDSLFFAFSGKAYAIFALLFGFSFFVQDYNQRMRGADFRLRFCRRLVALFVIGCVDACFFTAEILVMYSLIGFVLVPACRLSNRAVAWLAGLCLAQPVCLYYIVRLLTDGTYAVPAVDEGPLWRATWAAQDAGSFVEMLRVNLWEGQLASLAWAWNHGRIFQTAGLFLTGMLIGRQGWLLRPALPYWGRALAVAIVCYFPLEGVEKGLPTVCGGELLEQSVMLVHSLSNLCLMVMWVAGILFALYCTTGLQRVLRLLIPYGKMSMTNYVTQGMVGSLLFYHWGLHLCPGIAESALIGVAIFVVQYAFCRAWTSRHSHGPFEGLWRRMTWGRLRG